MKIFESNIDTLKRSSPAKLSKRFVACVIDLFLVALIAEGIFAGAFQITKSTSAYTAAEAVLDSEISYYEDLTEDTHIVEYVDGERVSTDVMVIKNLYRAICLSYELFGNDQQTDFIFDADHDVMINGTHTLENDNVAYFYTYYLKENNELNILVDDNIFEIYKKSFEVDAAVMFTFNAELSELPVLNTQVAYYLFHYLFIDSSDTIGQAGAKYYDAYYRGYSNMLEEAESLILESEPYNSTHYVRYAEAYTAQARYTNISLVLSIIVACLVMLLIPRYLFKDGKTVGYKLMGLGVTSTDGTAISWYVSLATTLIECIGFIPIAFILYLFPPFNGGFDAMFTPIVSGSKLSFAWVIIILLAIGGVVNGFGLFTHKRQNLINMVFDDVVVDTHYIDEGERDETNHGRSY